MELKNNSQVKFPVRMINYIIYNRLRILNKVLSLIYINTFWYYTLFLVLKSLQKNGGFGIHDYPTFTLKKYSCLLEEKDEKNDQTPDRGLKGRGSGVRYRYEVNPTSFTVQLGRHIIFSYLTYVSLCVVAPSSYLLGTWNKIICKVLIKGVTFGKHPTDW